MGSAKEPEAWQLKEEAVSEDAHPSDTSLPCSQEKATCLQNIRCDGGDLTMRNYCVNDLGTKQSSQGDTMVDSPNQKEKAPAVDMKDPAAATDTVVLKDSRTEEIPLEKRGETEAGSDLWHNSKQGSSLKELPDSSTNTCNPLEREAAGKISPADENRGAGEAGRPVLVEPCLKGATKDLSGAPASLKHVAFLEPTKSKAEAESTVVGTAYVEAGPTVQKTSEGQPCPSKGDVSHFSSDTCEAVERLSEGHGDTLASEAAKKSVPESMGTETASGRSGKPGAETNQLDHCGETRVPISKTNTGGSPSMSSGTPTAPASVPHEVQHRGTPGDSKTTTSQATEGTEMLREATASSNERKNQAQEQQKEAASVGVGEEHATEAELSSANLTKTCSLEVTPPQHDAGTQVDNRVSVVSIAVSPINPPDGSSAFPFHPQGSSLKSPGLEQKPTKKDVEMQVSIPVETRSVATGPMTPVTKSPQASYPEVHVKGAQEETPEPVREVSWDEKGMTWEVYGASMEVEVLGMAIQKHLEKQIEEHGRQVVMSPQSTRTSSIKGAPHKGEVKRQPSMFRALLQNMRRPRCCSQGGPAME
ncbi:G protein-regulated inducer of neurite outgrowth 1 [Tiliqua scincoides]|uniref:G protein-regulated inducer of neurite outgrowth 1 n=1 Tax=Tiliqua scincoides TaxID=71010 RepID=UPI00346321C8